MKEKKQQKKPQNKQAKPKAKESNPTVLSFGKVDFIYKIEFNEKDLEKPENENKEEVKENQEGNGENVENKDNKENKENKYYNIEDFNSIQDLKFIKDKKNIWDKIQLVPNNSTLEQLIIANRISKKKMTIDYIGYGIPTFTGDDEFFKEIYNYVNEKNCIEINPKPLNESGAYSIVFELYFKDKNHSFSVGSSSSSGGGSGEGEGEEKKEEEGGEQQKEKEKENEGEDYEQNEAMKQGKIPKFSRKSSILCELVPKYNKYTSFYLNYDDIKNIPGDFEKRDLIELIFFLKKKGAKIFLNFYQPQEEKEEKKEEEEGNKNKDNHLAEETYDSSSGKKKEKEKEKEQGKEEENNEEESKEVKEMKDLNNLYYLTDLYFFENKQAIEAFDKHYQTFTSDKEKKKINKQKLYDYFIKGIASGTKNEVDGDKLGFFVDDFLKYFIVHASKKKAKKYEFDCQLYPKINHNNMNLIEDYKKIIKKNMNHYISLFITFIISGVTSNEGATSNEVIIGAFLNSLEIIKRKLECEKNNIVINEKELMKYKLSEKNLAARIEELALGSQEDGFVLDCTNKEKSELKEYVPLYDYHLVYYFRSDINKKELQKKGFINEKGFIMYDPVHRKRMRHDLEKKKLNDEEKVKKVEGNIKNIDVGSRIKDKEIDSSKINADKNMVTVKRLPKSKYGIVKKKDKPKKERNKKDKANPNDQSGSGSGSDSGGEEEKKEENKNENNNNNDTPQEQQY